MHAIAVAGHVCVDLTPELGPEIGFDPGKLLEIGPLEMTLGGCVANTARTLTALGAPVAVSTAVGDDELGDFVRRSLADDPLLLGAPEVRRGESTSYSLVIEPLGANRMFWHHVGANSAFDGRSVVLGDADLVHLGYPQLLPALTAEQGAPLVALLERARAAGVTTSIDLAVVDPASGPARDWPAVLAAMAARTDVLSPSLDDLTSALGIDEEFSPALVLRLQELLLDWGCAVVAISAGEHGLFVKTAAAPRFDAAGRALQDNAADWADREFRLPPVWRGVPDTTNGAGDASSAGLVFGIAHGFGPNESARLASLCSAAVISGGEVPFDEAREYAAELGRAAAGQAR